MNELSYASATVKRKTASGFGSLQDDTQPTAGMLLRAAREASGLHIAALAVSLKVPVKKLEALEQDRADLLPDNVFARALAASVCRSLKVDPGPVLARLPHSGGNNLKVRSQGAPTPFSSSGERSASPFRMLAARPAVVAGLALVLGSLVLVFWPTLKEAGLRIAARGDLPRAPGSAVASEPLVLELTGPGDAGTTAAGLLRVADGKAATSSPSPSVFSAPGSGSTVLPASARNTVDVLSVANAALPSAASGIVTFRAKEQSWIEVTDAKGVVVLRRTLTAGEFVGATGALPMAAAVGRADATEVEVRGKPVDLKSLSRDNVARFEVK